MSGLIRLHPRPTTAEIARAARVHPQTVLKAHRTGELTSGAQIGRSLTFDAREVAQWLHSHGITNVVLDDAVANREKGTQEYAVAD